MRIFGLHCTLYVQEFFGALFPHKVTTLLLKGKSTCVKKGASFSSYPESHVHKIFIPKLGKGKFGYENSPSLIDYLFYSFMSVVFLPYILMHKKIIFVTPPFFDVIIIPILKLFGRQTYIITMDSQMATQTSYNKTIVRKIYYKFARFLEVMAVKLSDKVFTVSKFMEQDYKKYNDQVYHLPNGADVEIIDKIKPKRTFDKFTITYLGGFEAWRGLDLLIDAFKNVNARLNAKLLLIGGGPDFERIKAYAGNDKNITLTGYMDHDAALARCKGSDVLVMPSRNTLASQSISSIKCFEYIVCGVPTLVTNSGEHAYWLRKFGAGLVVPDNTEGFAQGLLKLKKNKKLYARLRQNALKNKANVDYKRFKKIFAEEVLK